MNVEIRRLGRSDGKRWQTAGAAILAAAAIATAMTPTSAQTISRARQATGSTCLTMAFGSGSTPFTRNFNPLTAAGALPALNLIYEPLMYEEPYTGRPIPWLATSYRWESGGRRLVFTIRKGVKWSDGVPFTAKDVVFTFKYKDAVSNATQSSATNNALSNIVGYSQPAPDEFAITLRNPDILVWRSAVENYAIIPEHIWGKISVKDAPKFTDPNPVGTGPFTDVRTFSGQVYELGRNPHYWQAGKPAIPCVRIPFFTSNDSIVLAQTRGDVDWAGSVIPNAQQTYVSHDPVHFHAYIARPNGTPIGLFYDDEKYPWSLSGFRKALSIAIDRNKIIQIAEYGNAFPTDGLGFNNLWTDWLDKSLEPQARALVTYSPAKAKAMLLKLGFTYKEGGHQLYDPHGDPVTVNMHVVASFTDWLVGMRIIQQNFKDIGIPTQISLDSTFNAWFELATKALTTHYMWTYAGPNPYQYFYSLLSKDTFAPAGTQIFSGNWSRFYDPQATALVEQWRTTTDAAKQRRLCYELERLMLDDFPYIPLYLPANYVQYSTRNVTGWPAQSSPLAGAGIGSPLVLLRLKPAS